MNHMLLYGSFLLYYVEKMLNISGGCGIIVYVNFYNPVLQVNI